MTPGRNSSDRILKLQTRLREIDEAAARMAEQMRQIRTALPALQTERREVRAQLARARAEAKVGLTEQVLARVGAGMKSREIARELKESPAVVSRVIEQAKAAERRKSRPRPSQRRAS